MYGLADRGLHGFGFAGNARVYLYTDGVIELKISTVDRGSDIGAKVLMLDVPHHAHDRGVELDVGVTALGDHAAQCIPGQAEKLSGELRIDHGDFRLALGVGRGELTASEDRLVQRGEVTRRDERLLVVESFVLRGFVA